MRLIFLGHACHLLEIDGLRVLMDPWLTDPIFGGHVERDPTLTFGPADLPPIDVIALTHGHLDHFNAPSLAALPDKSIPVVHPPIQYTDLDRNLEMLGFHNQIVRDDWEPFEVRGVRVVPTPSQGVIDECAYLVEGSSGRFWNGADAPQTPEVVGEIARRFGPISLGAFGHNSFNQPALLGLDAHKPADHGPQGAACAARILGVEAAVAGASNMRWCGPHGKETTEKVIRRRPHHFQECLAREAPDVAFVDLQPGDAWSREGGVERGVVRGSEPARVANDYIHALLETGERWCGDDRPSTDEIFRVHLPARMAADPVAASYVGQPVSLEIVGDDPGTATVDFRRPAEGAVAGEASAPYALRIRDEDWKDLFERRVSWQVLLASDRLVVTRVRSGAPPEGLHFTYALQAVFP